MNDIPADDLAAAMETRSGRELGKQLLPRSLARLGILFWDCLVLLFHLGRLEHLPDDRT